MAIDTEPVLNCPNPTTATWTDHHWLQANRFSWSEPAKREQSTGVTYYPYQQGCIYIGVSTTRIIHALWAIFLTKLSLSMNIWTPSREATGRHFLLCHLAMSDLWAHLVLMLFLVLIVFRNISHMKKLIIISPSICNQHFPAISDGPDSPVKKTSKWLEATYCATQWSRLPQDSGVQGVSPRGGGGSPQEADDHPMTRSSQNWRNIAFVPELTILLYQLNDTKLPQKSHQAICHHLPRLVARQPNTFIESFVNPISMWQRPTVENTPLSKSFIQRHAQMAFHDKLSIAVHVLVNPSSQMIFRTQGWVIMLPVGVRHALKN